MDDHRLYWISFSAGSILVYLFTLMCGWSWNNYFTISLIVGVQFYFWIAKQQEHLYLSRTTVIYSFLFIKKRINSEEFKYQPAEIYDYPRRWETLSCDLLILKSRNREMSISSMKWGEDYKRIESFIIENYNENPYLKNPYSIRFHNESSSISLGLIGLTLIVFGLGLFRENLKSSYVTEMRYVESQISSPPEVVTHKTRNGSRTYSLHFRLKDYQGYKFVLPYRGFKIINGHDFAKKDLIGKNIGFFVDKLEYEHEIMGIYTYRYFTSHVEHSNYLQIVGILFEGEHIINASVYSPKSENNHHATSIAFILFGGAFLGFSIYGVKISYKYN